MRIIQELFGTNDPSPQARLKNEQVEVIEPLNTGSPLSPPVLAPTQYSKLECEVLVPC